MKIRHLPIRQLIRWQAEPLGETAAKHGFDPRLKEAMKRRRICVAIVHRRMLKMGAAALRQRNGKRISLDVRIAKFFARWMPSAAERKRFWPKHQPSSQVQAKQLLIFGEVSP